jgi:Methylene-tetrahydromethanopterin dehydrogenase, N-terminal.
MVKRSILHMFDPMPNNSPFDINMALDAGFDVLIPYSNVKLDSVYGLTQDATFLVVSQVLNAPEFYRRSRFRAGHGHAEFK